VKLGAVRITQLVFRIAIPICKRAIDIDALRAGEEDIAEAVVVQIHSCRQGMSTSKVGEIVLKLERGIRELVAGGKWLKAK
jgi:hypothetical protein